MAKNGFQIFDSDMHIMEPPDLWERYIESELKSRSPRGVTSENVRDLGLVHPDGRHWARKPIVRFNTNRGHNFERNQDIYQALRGDRVVG